MIAGIWLPKNKCEWIKHKVEIPFLSFVLGWRKMWPVWDYTPSEEVFSCYYWGIPSLTSLQQPKRITEFSQHGPLIATTVFCSLYIKVPSPYCFWFWISKYSITYRKACVCLIWLHFELRKKQKWQPLTSKNLPYTHSEAMLFSC